MREVNFSIPGANKASVAITTALYDRRALDCTSTLPLINSLNHLAYLTTSSARIRDILTVDGGIERLVRILKQGRSKDVMDMWKWNLAYQCLFNIGVRGSELVRTRVVEADLVPVIATLLDNYITLVDRSREQADQDADGRRAARPGPCARHASHHTPTALSARPERSRRAAPLPMDIPPRSQPALDAPLPDDVPVPPPERTLFARAHHSHASRSQSGHASLLALSARSHAGSERHTPDAFAMRPVRDADRLPSTLPPLQGELTLQPESPTTQSSPAARPRRRPPMRHELSTSGESDDGQQDETMTEPTAATTPAAEPMVGMPNGVHVADMVDNAEMLDAEATPVALAPAPPEATDESHETFNITHRSALDGSIIHPAATPPAGALPGLSPAQAPNAGHAGQPPIWYPRYVPDRNAAAMAPTALPRDEDVLMSLQLLAYVSKYCYLRSYFQRSHLVPRLRLADVDGADDDAAADALERAVDEEYQLPDDYNIFPLVEKFTVRHHTAEMQYWASVVMRNLCRKDDLRGGIRQCAYYQCGRWEECARQFAKCRRCRRTKYCSKECQKSAWVYHRHWCVAAQQ